MTMPKYQRPLWLKIAVSYSIIMSLLIVLKVPIDIRSYRIASGPASRFHQTGYVELFTAILFVISGLGLKRFNRLARASFLVVAPWAIFAFCVHFLDRYDTVSFLVMYASAIAYMFFVFVLSRSNTLISFGITKHDWFRRGGWIMGICILAVFCAILLDSIFQGSSLKTRRFCHDYFFLLDHVARHRDEALWYYCGGVVAVSLAMFVDSFRFLKKWITNALDHPRADCTKDLAGELERLDELRKKGLLTEEEYSKAKTKPN